ncbi:hypothetical protein QQF64_010339 [Cirrhinus molitorella]|uniref:Ras-related protein Rab-42 n=1 Tax=Cirrhinus molitorella TaxID=172907 RepID=A0ABR3M3Q5_9TELE
MIGGNSVGKSCMLSRYINGHFPESINVTIGVGISIQILEVEAGVKVKLQILDTAGHELFWKAICYSLPQSSGCLLVFDLCSYNSFTYVKQRYTEVCDRVRPYTVLFVLVGHKCDRKDQEVNQEEVEEFASELGVPYIEASARTVLSVMDLTLWQYQFRVIMLGDSTVGKSSMLKRYTEDLFLECINQTVGVDFYVHFLEVEPGVRVKLQFWDTAGQERFRSVTRSYYRNSVGGLLVFDLGNRKSFENVQQWYAEVCERVQPYTVLFVLVGHKSDRVKAGERAVDRTEAERLASQLGAPYIEASAKTGHNVKEAFELLTRRVYQGIKCGEIQLRDGWDGVKSSAPTAQILQRIQNSEAAEKNKSCAC